MQNQIELGKVYCYKNYLHYRPLCYTISVREEVQTKFFFIKRKIKKVVFYITVESCDPNGNTLSHVSILNAEDFVLNSFQVR